jgi:superfamily II DNA or RNA helicase
MKNLKFKGEWREYQERVLNELESHLDDENLHVVAAPGAGKTILGIEVMNRINKPTLILSPSISIRNQWISRMCSMFLPGDALYPDWVSTDIKKPKYLTVITYQALHAAFSGEAEEKEADEMQEEETSSSTKARKSKAVDVINLLNKQKVEAIVLDEAHHLRKEWWKALTRLKKELNSPHMVSLTATPPYDVSFTEWQKYEDLCGAIDAEISVPELVKRGDLCPHQDYVYFSLPKENESTKLRQFKNDVTEFVISLKSDQRFLDVFNSHPWICDTKNNVEDILSDPKMFSAMIIFLNFAGVSTPRYALNLLGISKSSIPEISPEWLEVLLTGILYNHVKYLPDHEDILHEIRNELKRIGAIERRKVVLDNTKEIKKLLASSLSKLDAILDITRTESSKLANDLRMVILADYIRSSELPSDATDLKPIGKLGVVPIFEYLRRANINGIKLGILTGSIVFIPKESKKLVDKIADDMNIKASNIKYKSVVYDENYLSVEIKGNQKQYIVQLITELFNQGGITTLVGTQALLGEGWDAPSINALILASYVGSYMLSNQMRGRAIRTNPDNPNKTANIWHLAAVDIETLQEKLQKAILGTSNRQTYFSPFDEIKEDIGNDIYKLRRRFKAFECLSFTSPVIIENGFKRLNLSGVKWDNSGVEKLNELMLQRSLERDNLPQLWEKALQGKSPKPQMKEKVESNFSPKGLAFADTIKYMVMNALIMGVTFGSQILNGVNSRNSSVQEVTFLILIGLVIATIYAFPKLLKALYLLIRNGSLEGSMSQVGYAVLDTLQYMQLIKTNPKNIRIETAKDGMGIVHCKIDGTTTIETRHFIEAMQEILGSVENQRYLLVRESYLGSILRVDYHPIPRVIGQNKKNALFFEKKWNRYVGGSKLVYTRSTEGRMTLLKARTQSLASNFKKKSEQLNVWE